MNLAKTYQIDKDGNMIGYTKYNKGEKVTAEPFHQRLKIISMRFLNYGVTFTVRDESGKTYNMNDVMFREYIENNDVYIEADWKFYQQGTVYSIGVQRC